MMDTSEHKSRNRSYFTVRLAIRREEWVPIFLALAAYIFTMGIGFLLYPR